MAIDEINVPTMAFDSPPDNGQTDTGTGRVGSHACESLENPLAFT